MFEWDGGWRIVVAGVGPRGSGSMEGGETFNVYRCDRESWSTYTLVRGTHSELFRLVGATRGAFGTPPRRFPAGRFQTITMMLVRGWVSAARSGRCSRSVPAARKAVRATALGATVIVELGVNNWPLARRKGSVSIRLMVNTIVSHGQKYGGSMSMLVGGLVSTLPIQP